MHVATTKISSKGQVVIPQDIRNALRIKDGDNFVVQAHEDTIVLRKLDELPPKALKTLALIEKAWKDIEQGKTYRYKNAEEAIKALRQWKSNSRKHSENNS